MSLHRIRVNKLNALQNSLYDEAIKLASTAAANKIPSEFNPKIEKVLAETTLQLSLIAESLVQGDPEYMTEMSDIAQKSVKNLREINKLLTIK